jgi:acylphosphatase
MAEHVTRPRPFKQAETAHDRSGLLMECRRFRVEGRVQGVWFRESTRREAERLGLTGFAENKPDGTVEVLACGAPEALDRLARWLRHGPRTANVTGLEWTRADMEPPGSFVTR